MNKKEILMPFSGFFSRYDLEGDIEKVSEFIKNIPNKLKEIYPLNKELQSAHRFAINTDSESDYGSDYSYDIYIVQAFRWETDEEFKARIELNKKQSAAAKERAKKQKEAKEKKEKTMYETLKKKFEV